MQISRVAPSILAIQHQGPSMVHDRLEQLVDQLDDLGTRLQRETKVGYHVSREWPAQVQAASTQLRFAADAVTRLGGDREALLGEALLADANDVSAFASELRTAYAAQDSFGPAHPEWIDRLARPARDAQTALLMLEQAPARP